jgi:arylsulfatase A-like enzyme
MASGLALAQSPRGNLCVIVVDDVGPELIGSCDEFLRGRGLPSGSPAATPAIDSYLREQGLYFPDTWSMPTCTPSRAMMLTGRIGSRSGIGRVVMPRLEFDNPGLEPDVELLPRLLRAAPQPYSSAAVGKWHLASEEQLELHPLHPLGSPLGSWFDRQAGSWFNFETPPSVPYWTAGYYVWSKNYSTPLVGSSTPCGGVPPCVVELNVNLDPDDYPSVDTIDDAIALVHDLPEPWFLWVALNAAHGPVHEVPAGLPSANCAPQATIQAPCVHDGIPQDASRMRCVLSALDGQLARLFCELDFGTTTVIFTSDNGTGDLAVAPPFDAAHAKGSVYQGGVQVPLLVRSPELAPQLVGTTSEALISLADVFDTVRQLAGAPSASDAEDSLSFLPILRGERTHVRRTVYTELFGPNFIPDPATGAPPAGYVCNRHDQALRDARYKLVRKWRPDPTSGAPLLTEELYDFVAGGAPDTSTQPATPRGDWMEQNDLLAQGVALDASAAAALQRLRRELDLRYPPLVR